MVHTYAHATIHASVRRNRIIEKDLPVAVEDIENETYRNHVVKSGYVRSCQQLNRLLGRRVRGVSP